MSKPKTCNRVASSAGLGHNERVVMYVIGLLEELRSKGLLDGDGMKIEPNGRAALKQMAAAGWKPTDAEILRVIDLMVADGTINVPKWPNDKLRHGPTP